MAGYLGKTPVTACDAGARQPDVIAALGSLGFAAESVLSRAQTLEERLSSILRPPAPTNCAEKSSELACQLAIAIGGETSRVRTADAILCDLLDRLEI